MLKLSHPIISINGFKIEDKVRLKDGDGRSHMIKSFSIDGIKEFFFEVQFEDGTETMLDNIAPLPSNLDEAARHYLLNEHCSPLNEIMHQADLKAEMTYHKDIESSFKAGAEWMAEQSFPRWRNIDEEKPKQGEDCACISVTVNGHIKYSNFEEGPWSWDDKVDSDWLGTTEAFVGYNFYGDKEYHTCSYWMPWDEFWGSLERQFKNSGME